MKEALTDEDVRRIFYDEIMHISATLAEKNGTYRRKPMITHEEIRRQVEEKDVRYLRLIFTDILGTIKNVEVPITQLDKVLANK